MKKADIYAKAFLRSIDGVDESTALSRLSALSNIVEKKEGLFFMKKVSSAILKGLEKVEDANSVTIVLANKEGKTKHTKEIASTLTMLHAEHVPHKETIDTTLIDGFRIQYKGTVHDRSAKRTLLNLYSSLTA